MSLRDLIQKYLRADTSSSSHFFMDNYKNEIDSLGLTEQEVVDTFREESAKVLCLYCSEDRKKLAFLLYILVQEG
ncbi:hypothetical protein BD560DRAFT_384571 [Blakeslea trispora]|nr:hypothetical protein BD560DRAFT_384571 [Blakeslea trispora]